jgi:uncharacterized RDD family membrane protein YckC
MSSAQRCSECRNEFPREDLVDIRGGLVCATCKPIALQRVDEYDNVNDNFKTAHFGIRVGAVLIDGIIGFIVGKLLEFIPGGTVLSVIFGIAYSVYFIGSTGSTPGKLILKIKVIRMDGSPVGYGLATGRYFANILSALILGIGYIMAAFDKVYAQTLHDKICKTRVVYIEK